HQFHLEVIGGVQGGVHRLLQQGGVHRVFQEVLVAAVDVFLPVKVHGPLGEKLAVAGRRLGHGSAHPCAQVISQVADGDKAAQLFFGDADAEGLLQVGHDGQDLHRGQVQIVHQDAVLGHLVGADLRDILQDAHDLCNDLSTAHNNCFLSVIFNVFYTRRPL